MPLAGVGVLVTRPEASDDPLVAGLREAGAEVHSIPLIRIEPPTDPGPLREAARGVGRYHWVLFTSPNGVRAFLDALPASTLPSGVKIAAVGPGTARALEARGVRVDLLPLRYVAEGLLEAFRDQGDLAGQRILLPRPQRARKLLPQGLEALGAEVLEVEAYRTVLDPTGEDRIRRLLTSGAVQWILFTSSSAVESFQGLMGEDRWKVGVGVIGPATGETARRLGYAVELEAPVHTPDGLAAALVAFYRR